MRCYHFCYILLAHRSTLVHCGRGVRMGACIKRHIRGSLGPSWRLPAMPPTPPPASVSPWANTTPALLCGLYFLFILSVWLGMMTLPLPTLRSRAEQILQVWTVSLFQPLGTTTGCRRACVQDLIRADYSILKKIEYKPGAVGTCLRCCVGRAHMAIAQWDVEGERSPQVLMIRLGSWVQSFL